MPISLPELKRRHESGEKLNKATRQMIALQLKRVCGNRECFVSLAFTRLGMYCSTKCGAREQQIVRTLNKQKKARYEEKHNIKRNKTIRNRNAPPTSSGVAYDGRTLLYEHYKEPLQPIEKLKGFGYYGTLALTNDKTLVQCHICGNLYPSVGAHLRKHRITAEKYKEMYKLAATTALISEPVRLMRQEKAVHKLKGKGLPVWLEEYNKKVQTGQIKHKGSKRREGGMSLEKRNMLGMCPDQVLEKIKDLHDKLGKIPGIAEFQEEYGGRYLGSITFQHGSWQAAVRKACKYSREDLRRLDKDKLIEELQQFHKANGRIPMTSDFARGMLRNKGAYISKFGTLNNARIEAGMNAVIPMPFGQVVELTPEQYLKYKEGHPVISKASAKKRQQRQAARLKKKIEVNYV